MIRSKSSTNSPCYRRRVRVLNTYKWKRKLFSWTTVSGPSRPTPLPERVCCFSVLIVSCRVMSWIKASVRAQVLFSSLSAQFGNIQLRSICRELVRLLIIRADSWIRLDFYVLAPAFSGFVSVLELNSIEMLSNAPASRSCCHALMLQPLRFVENVEIAAAVSLWHQTWTPEVKKEGVFVHDEPPRKLQKTGGSLNNWWRPPLSVFFHSLLGFSVIHPESPL